jgi:hypothetical protein
VLIAEGLLAVDQDHVGAAAGELPVLEAVVEQQGVAAEVLHGIATGFDPVLVDQNHHISQVGCQHVGFIASSLRVEQQRLAIRDNAGRGGVFSEQDLVEETFRDGLGLGSVSARQDSHFATGILKSTGKFLDDRSLSGTAHREIAYGDNLNTQG